MRWRNASELPLPVLGGRLSARDTVIFDTPTRAATSAIVTGRRTAGAALPEVANRGSAQGSALQRKPDRRYR